MENKRILSYTMAQKLTPADLENISAAGTTTSASGNGTYNAQGWDGGLDVSMDL